MKRILTTVALLGGVLITSTACDPVTGTQPVVVTNTHNELLDMPPGVQWDVQYEDTTDEDTFVTECYAYGGTPDLTTWICQDIDY